MWSSPEEGAQVHTAADSVEVFDDLMEGKIVGHNGGCDLGWSQQTSCGFPYIHMRISKYVRSSPLVGTLGREGDCRSALLL